ncbi:MAG: cytochrome c3 family protein [Acidobacteriota bacterium]
MAQIFPKRINRLPVVAAGVALLVPALGSAFVWYFLSPKHLEVGYQPRQPVPFSHKLHAGDMRLDCRYCHGAVEVSAVASVPPTQVCMNCHQLVGRDKESLQPLYESAATGRPMEWIRIHDLADYSYFDHSVHLLAGVGCSSCHGDIRSMEVVRQVEPLSMAWCLECHRQPEMHLRPREELTNTTWIPPDDQLIFAQAVIADLQIAPPEDCSACHR